MRLHLLASIALVLLAPACKKKGASAGEAIARFSEFTDRVCACKDRACTERVTEDMTKWSMDMQRSHRDAKPTADEMKRMTDLGQRYGECVARFSSSESSAPFVGGGAVPATTEKITNADRLIKVTYDNLGAHAVSRLRLSYVRADGTIDDTYGKALVDLGTPKPPDPADDPNRPIGAPVITRDPIQQDFTARCPVYSWEHGQRTTAETSCVMSDQGLARPKCSVVEIWKRAIDKGAPKQGLAVMELRGGKPQSWHFSIDDDPRNIHFSLDVEDTCEPTLEAPR